MITTNYASILTLRRITPPVRISIFKTASSLRSLRVVL
jgi:hypothetical protein